jgi:hypothetical protein
VKLSDDRIRGNREPHPPLLKLVHSSAGASTTPVLDKAFELEFLKDDGLEKILDPIRDMIAPDTGRESTKKKSSAVATRSFLKSSKASGMKFTTLPDNLSDLVNFIGISSHEFDKLFKRVSVETITLANAEMRRKVGNYLDEMESMLEVIIADLSVMADDVRDDKIVLRQLNRMQRQP